MSELRLALLGAPHIAVGEKSVVVESRKAQALLFYLAVTKQRQRRDSLAALFWPEQGQSRARASLRQALWLLRTAGLEQWLMVEQDALALPGEYWCDVDRFRAAIDTNDIDEALALYRDDLLAGFNLRDCPEFDQWHFLQADELRRLLASALEQSVLRCREEGEFEKGLAYARRWLQLDNLHEPAHRHLMLLHAYAGQFAAAIRQYEDCERLLEDELGVPPAEETSELYQAIKTRQIAPPVKARPEMSAAEEPSRAGTVFASDGKASTGAQIALSAAPHHNLPLHFTSFVGREAEIEELTRIIAKPECRLVSIIGPGGIGKTRLAVQVAHRFTEVAMEESMAEVNAPASPSHLFPQGVLFVALNAVETINGVIAAIAEAGGFVFYSNDATRQQLLEYLHERKMLLLLDNFEHLLGSTDFIVDLLTHAPYTKILVTSREALNLQGEWLWSLGGLDIPEDDVAEDSLWDYSAIRMFVQSARRIQPNFSLATEYPHVVRICRSVGGMPLAIELAVGWLRVLACAQIAHEIAQDLDFLTTRLRDMPQRHRSIQTVFEQSWRLLSSSGQETFQQLSIFRGGFDRNAAAQIAGASWLDLVALTEKSLLKVDTNGRYTIHELLRQYGAAKLAESPGKKEATSERFCTYFANFLYERESVLFGHGQVQVAADIAIEFDNIRAAWQWALQQGRLEEIRRSASALYFFCQLQSRFLEGAEALQQAQHVLEAMPASHQRDLTLANICCHQGWLCLRLGEFEKAISVLQRSLDLDGRLHEPSQRFIAGPPSVPLAIVYHIQGDFRRALELAEEALHMAEAQNDQHSLAFTHYALAATNLGLGCYEKARSHIDGASESARVVGNRWFLPYILNESGKVSRAIGNYAQAFFLFQESYDIKREFNDPEGMAVALNHLGEIAYLQSDYETAQQRYKDAYAMYGEINDQGGLAVSSRGLGQVACARGDLGGAKVWFEKSLKIAMQIRFWPLLYSLLVDVTHLFMQTNAQLLAIEALALVRNQPASDYETRARATQQLHQWQSQLAAESFEIAVQLGSEGDAEALLQRILTEVTVAT